MSIQASNFPAPSLPFRWATSGSEFDAERDCSRNLTDFQTRVVWSSPDLRKYMQQIYSPFHYLRRNLSQKCDSSSETKPFDSSCFLNCTEIKPPLSSIEPTEKVDFWRPFTPEPLLCSPCQVSDHDESQQGVNLSISARQVKPFPAITPTTVKLGGSVKSVFRSVKRRRYQCQFCGMSYLNQGQLTGHIRIHTGSKPYLCDYPDCSRAFARNEELTRHRRIHSGYKPHHCDICDKQFGRKDHLNKHRKTHLKVSEKKVYLCQYPGCGHRYTRSDALTRHQTTTHSSKASKLDNT